MGAMMMPSTAVPGHAALEYGVAARPLRGHKESGDLSAVIPRPRGVLIAVADGLGHGYEAAVAAKVALVTLTEQAHRPFLELLKRCHEALIKTRGAAMSLASLECHDGAMTWLSIGNVAGLLLRDSGSGGIQREHILMRNGVVGHRLPPLRATTQRLRQGDLLIFATDGVREGFERGISLDTRPQETADRILAQYGKATDDALVLVARWNGSSMQEPENQD
jgi:serine phosphatase RsbU (regulator of sigma subunit)